jgi:hypothetical protein
MAKKLMEVVNMYLAPIIRDAIRKKEEAKAVAIAVGEKVGDGDGEDEDEGTLIDHLVGLTSGEWCWMFEGGRRLMHPRSFSR